MATNTTTGSNNKYSYTSRDNKSQAFANTRLTLRNVSVDPESHVPSGNTTILDRGSVPDSHKRIADSFMIIRKIYGFPIIHSRLTPKEIELFEKYKLKPLAQSTFKQMRDEIYFLRDSHENGNRALRDDCNKILEIRTKELKRLISSNYVDIEDNIYNGHKALEKYFEDITKY